MMFAPSSDAVLSALVERALAGDAPLDALLSAHLFPGTPAPRMWRDWPHDARAAWDRASLLYTDELRARRLKERGAIRFKGIRLVTRAEAWDAILGLGRDPWWHVGDHAWLRIGKALSLGDRATEHHLRTRLGFAFEGRTRNRRITAGPCRACGVVAPAEALAAGLCPPCR